jgi:hypothetical protein
MDAEQIVRAAAAKKAPVDGEFFYCHWCKADWGLGSNDYEAHNDPRLHDEDCPWRLAREWVAAHPG